MRQLGRSTSHWATGQGLRIIKRAVNDVDVNNNSYHKHSFCCLRYWCKKNRWGRACFGFLIDGFWTFTGSLAASNKGVLIK